MTPKKILFIGPVRNEHSADGYSNGAMGMLDVLMEMQKRNLIKSLNAIDLNDIYNIQVPLNYYDIVILIINPFFINNPAYKTQLENVLKKGNKAYLQMVWETDPMPSYWNQIFESNMFTGFIAPSQFVARLMKAKTTKEIYHIPHFINTDAFSRIDLERKKKENIFSVLTIGQWTKRKGNEDAIAAFARALGDKPDCRLIVKYTGLKDVQMNIDDQIRIIMRMNTPQIVTPVLVSGDNLPFGDLLNLFKMSSVLLFPSRGEGFGLPLAEAMSVGIPIIYTNWSATAEVANAPGNLSIRYLLDECVGMSQFGYEKGAKYAIPYMTDLISALEYKYLLWKESRETYYKETIDNYKIIDEKFGMNKLIEHFLEFLELSS